MYSTYKVEIKGKKNVEAVEEDHHSVQHLV